MKHTNFIWFELVNREPKDERAFRKIGGHRYLVVLSLKDWKNDKINFDSCHRWLQKQLN